MPIEIKELIIRTSIRENSPTPTPQTRPAEKDEIIQEAVEKVMEILEKKKER